MHDLSGKTAATLSRKVLGKAPGLQLQSPISGRQIHKLRAAKTKISLVPQDLGRTTAHDGQ